MHFQFAAQCASIVRQAWHFGIIAVFAAKVDNMSPAIRRFNPTGAPRE